MIEIDPKPWQTMVLHAERTYPNECCGAMLGHTQGDAKLVTEAVPLDNAYRGEQGQRYELRPEDLLEADKAARARGLDLIGIFHSHPDCDAYLLRNGPEELVSLVFLPRAFYSERYVRSCKQFSARPGSNTGGERRTEMAKIVIPTALRQYTDQKDSVEVNGATVGEALKQLTTEYPNIKQNLYNEQGKLRSFVNVYVNDEDIRYLDKDATRLEGNETISIVPSIAGGSTGIAEPDTAALTSEELVRYSRHLILPEVGMEGQLKLKQAKVALIGAGGLGAPLGLYLAAAGVGSIGLVDFDVVDASNLQRQVIHGTKDLGRKKLDSAADRIQDINPNVRMDKLDTGLTSGNALDILKDYDLVIDGTDNFPTRYLVNDACVLLKKPNVYGSIFRFEGQATVFAYEDGPCYRCLYPEPPPPGLVPSCAEGGVLGILPGIIGLIQATEAVKIILGAGETLKGRLLLYDALGMSFRELKLRRDPNCPVCGDHPTVTKLIDYQEFCGVRPMATQPPPSEGVIDAVELKQMLDRGDDFVLIDVREPYEYQIAKIPGARLIPLGELPKRLKELDPEADIVAHCKSGGRSQKAVDLLKQNGFKRVRNMTGGILAWSHKVDPTVAKY